ncbi:PAS modulated sigma54 specific transcriptional regulator, Fis family [Pelosinus sp. UFO1]|nr:PAS modulated sigma54 specific transcriptional regulator, Fis family [Pelosinus sp. UFO1]
MRGLDMGGAAMSQEKRSVYTPQKKQDYVAWDPHDRKLEVFLNSTYDAMIAVDEHGIISLFNCAAERLLMVKAEDMLGRPVSEVVPGTRLPLVLSSGISELNQQQTIGHLRIVTNRMPVRDSDNKIIGAVAVFRDITDIINLSGEITSIKEMKILLESIIESSQDAISVVDRNGKIILVNPAYTSLIGLSKDEVLGKSPTIDICEGESMHIKVMKTLVPVRGVPLQVGPQSKEVIVNAAPLIINGELQGSVAVVHDVSEIRQLNEELGRMKCLIRKIQSRYTFDDIVAQGSAMLNTVELARRAANTPVTVLLTGETGTGKELFAHAIHHASQRKNNLFVRVNCAALTESLLESELFGYEEGAFTGGRKGGKKGLFEEADGGSILLDEIGEISLAVQVKLLRVLQEKEIVRVGGVKPIPVQIRVIAATNRDLFLDVKRGLFREDLYYRLNIFPIAIPPLRQRLDEMPHLVDFLLKKLNQEYGRNVQSVSNEALRILSSYLWPGNIRELENVLARGMINMRFSESTMLFSHLPPLLPLAGSCDMAKISTVNTSTLAEALERAEHEAVVAALAANRGCRENTAKQLGISLRNLYYKIKKYNIASG